MQIFAGVWEIWGVKQESGRLRCRFSYLSLAIFSESSSTRLKLATHSICVKLLHKHDKLTQCCRTFTLALARLSCNKAGDISLQIAAVSLSLSLSSTTDLHSLIHHFTFLTRPAVQMEMGLWLINSAKVLSAYAYAYFTRMQILSAEKRGVLFLIITSANLDRFFKFAYC